MLGETTPLVIDCGSKAWQDMARKFRKELEELDATGFAADTPIAAELANQKAKAAVAAKEAKATEAAEKKAAAEKAAAE